MLRHRLYYTLKPFLPWGFRIALRRILACRTREKYKEVWPIWESAGRTPNGWPGWPDGKKFAFVITHDVEGPEGLEKCRRLAELEMELGFRSSFNFIPEGSYTVSPDLRAWLTDHGFEVGVHDLHHDGKLFADRRRFAAKASRINSYLRAWGATGFRAGFMLRNLDWLHHLDIAYDASTFDTDPFEPQSDGVRTIFPFWIPAPTPQSSQSPGDSRRADPSAVLSAIGSAQVGGSAKEEASRESLPYPPLAALPSVGLAKEGCVELPYTLPQDSTLFLLLRERSPEIWLRKLDWIATRGGMALVNVHPDYLRLDGEPSSSRTFSVEHYRTLLQHVRDLHAGRYWHALPRAVAGFAQTQSTSLVLRRPKRVCMLTHSFYETDSRVTRYAEALAERGDQEEIFALQYSRDTPREEIINGVRVIRLQCRHGSTRHSAVAYFLHLVHFLIISSWKITRTHAQQPYDVLHIHNMPDFLVFAAWYPKLTGARVILDIHDIVPELYSSKFGDGRTGKTTALLKWIERMSARFAHHVIISNHLWFEKFAARTESRHKCSVFINNVDSHAFRPGLRTRTDDKLIVLFPGGLQWHQGLDIAIRAFQEVSRVLPKAEFHIYGEGNMKPSLESLAADLGIAEKVKFFAPVRLKEIVQVMANADLGVVPKRADSFGNEAYSTKIMEFMSVGVPVVVSRTKIDEFYFSDSVVRFFESGNSHEMAKGMLDILGNRLQREAMVAKASAYASQNSWESRKPDYLSIIDSI